jgi:hypothetical protein
VRGLPVGSSADQKARTVVHPPQHSRQTWGRQVAYGSQFKPAYDRANARAQKIYNRLGGSSLDAAIPDKPKGMHWRTYESKLDRAEAYDMQYGLALAGFIMRLKR